MSEQAGPPEVPGDAITAAAVLTGAVTALTDRLGEFNKASVERDEALAKYGRRSRILAIVGIVSTALDIILTVVAVTAITVALHAQDRAQQAIAREAAQHSSLVAACVLGNQSRAAETGLWTHIYDLSVNARTPPKERAADNRLITYIRREFAPRDCARLYGKS